MSRTKRLSAGVAVGVVTDAAADPVRVAFGSPGRPGWITGTLGVEGAISRGGSAPHPAQAMTALSPAKQALRHRNEVGDTGSM